MHCIQRRHAAACTAFWGAAGVLKLIHCTRCGTLCSKNVDFTFTGEALAKQVLPLPAFSCKVQQQAQNVVLIAAPCTPGICALLTSSLIAVLLQGDIVGH